MALALPYISPAISLSATVQSRARPRKYRVGKEGHV
jgi:hypothetical protein